MLNAYALNTRAINALESASLRAHGLVGHMSMAGQLQPTLSATLSAEIRIVGEIVAYPLVRLPISSEMFMAGQLLPALSATLDSSMAMAGSARWRAKSDLPPTAVAYVLATDRTAYVKEVT